MRAEHWWDDLQIRQGGRCAVTWVKRQRMNYKQVKWQRLRRSHRVLAVYCDVTNYSKLSKLKQRILTVCQFLVVLRSDSAAQVTLSQGQGHSIWFSNRANQSRVRSGKEPNLTKIPETSRPSVGDQQLEQCPWTAAALQAFMVVSAEDLPCRCRGQLVWSLVWKDPTCHGTAKSLCTTAIQACALEPVNHNYWSWQACPGVSMKEKPPVKLHTTAKEYHSAAGTRRWWAAKTSLLFAKSLQSIRPLATPWAKAFPRLLSHELSGRAAGVGCWFPSPECMKVKSDGVKASSHVSF